MPLKLSAFPKCYIEQIAGDRTMSVFQWIEMAKQLDADGLEMLDGFFTSLEPGYLDSVGEAIHAAGFVMPMLCCSPDFTHPDKKFRDEQIALEKGWIDMTAELGGRFCRVLSGQRRPEVSRADGIRYAAESIEACIPHAQSVGVTLILENHYKDNYWQFPEFAQHTDVFCDLVAAIDHGHLDMCRGEGFACCCFSGGHELPADAAGLKLRVDAEQAEIGEAFAAIGDVDAAENDVPVERDQQAAVAVEQRAQGFEVGALARDQVRLVRPASAGGVAAIGAFDHRMQTREIGLDGPTDCDHRF